MLFLVEYEKLNPTPYTLDDMYNASLLPRLPLPGWVGGKSVFLFLFTINALISVLTSKGQQFWQAWSKEQNCCTNSWWRTNVQYSIFVTDRTHKLPSWPCCDCGIYMHVDDLWFTYNSYFCLISETNRVSYISSSFELVTHDADTGEVTILMDAEALVSLILKIKAQSYLQIMLDDWKQNFRPI